MPPELMVFSAAAATLQDDPSRCLKVKGDDVGSIGRFFQKFTRAATHVRTIDAFLEALKTQYGDHIADLVARGDLGVRRRNSQPLCGRHVTRICSYAAEIDRDLDRELARRYSEQMERLGLPGERLTEDERQMLRNSFAASCPKNATKNAMLTHAAELAQEFAGRKFYLGHPALSPEAKAILARALSGHCGDKSVLSSAVDWRRALDLVAFAEGVDPESRPFPGSRSSQGSAEAVAGSSPSPLDEALCDWFERHPAELPPEGAASATVPALFASELRYLREQIIAALQAGAPRCDDLEAMGRAVREGRVPPLQESQANFVGAVREQLSEAQLQRAMNDPEMQLKPDDVPRLHAAIRAGYDRETRGCMIVPTSQGLLDRLIGSLRAGTMQDFAARLHQVREAGLDADNLRVRAALFTAPPDVVRLKSAAEVAAGLADIRHALACQTLARELTDLSQPEFLAALKQAIPSSGLVTMSRNAAALPDFFVPTAADRGAYRALTPEALRALAEATRAPILQRLETLAATVSEDERRQAASEELRRVQDAWLQGLRAARKIGDAEARQRAMAGLLGNPELVRRALTLFTATPDLSNKPWAERLEAVWPQLEGLDAPQRDDLLAIWIARARRPETGIPDGPAATGRTTPGHRKSRCRPATLSASAGRDAGVMRQETEGVGTCPRSCYIHCQPPSCHSARSNRVQNQAFCAP